MYKTVLPMLSFCLVALTNSPAHAMAFASAGPIWQLSEEGFSRPYPYSISVTANILLSESFSRGNASIALETGTVARIPEYGFSGSTVTARAADGGSAFVRLVQVIEVSYTNISEAPLGSVGPSIYYAWASLEANHAYDGEFARATIDFDVYDVEPLAASTNLLAFPPDGVCDSRQGNVFPNFCSLSAPGDTGTKIGGVGALLPGETKSFWILIDQSAEAVSVGAPAALAALAPGVMFLVVARGRRERRERRHVV